MSAPTTAQAVVTGMKVSTGTALWFQEGTGWTSTSANATLYATLTAAQNRADQLNQAPYGLVAVAVPALCLNNWTTRS